MAGLLDLRPERVVCCGAQGYRVWEEAGHFIQSVTCLLSDLFALPGIKDPTAGVLHVQGIADVRDLASGWQHSCARETGGQIKCWGDNSAGQLGDGTVGGLAGTTLKYPPVHIAIAEGTP